MLYTLRQLEVFLAVAHSENISRAADSLAMSQSAVSGALADLEKQFDIQLFDRIGKRIKINNLGESVRPFAKALLDQAHFLERQLQAPGKQVVGKVKVGATLTIGNYLATNLIADYMQKFPQSSVALDIDNTETITRRLLNFEIDVGLIEGEIVHPQLKTMLWREDELTLFCSNHHPLANQKGLKEPDIKGLKWILREEGSGTRQTFERGMHGLLTQLDVLLVLKQTEAIKQAVASNLGVSCLPKLALEQEFHQGVLRPFNMAGRQFKRNFYVILHRNRYHTPQIDNWLKICGLTTSCEL